MYVTPAWILPIGDERNPAPGHLEYGEIPFAALEPDEALVEPLYVGWEGNCYHAVQRRPSTSVRPAAKRASYWATAGWYGYFSHRRPHRRKTCAKATSAWYRETTGPTRSDM